MRLIFIYGPPASGKLTIAQILSAKTGIPLFHNHLSRDIVREIYGNKLMEHYSLVDTIRTDVLSYCASHDTDLIFTYVYEGKSDDANVRRLIDAVENNGGKIVFVELRTNREDLLQRVGNDSRKRHKKLIDPKFLERITEDMSIYTMSYVDSFVINTSKTQPEDAARLIVNKFGL